jgi:diguanylate cyclase (GGDEF)-like protein
VSRTRLRTRVLLLTCAFSLALFGIAFGLSWRTRVASRRWERLVGVETQAIATLEEVIRAQNAFRAQHVRQPERYSLVSQLLDDGSAEAAGTAVLRARMRAFRTLLTDPATRDIDLDATSFAVVSEARRLVSERKRVIAQQLPLLAREGRDTVYVALGVAWMVVLCSFAAVQLTLRKVVRPIEELAMAADRVAAGDVTARADVNGDYEVARLGIAFNRMADELKARARTDELTSLPNFRAFRERIDLELERASRYPSVVGVLVLDLDRFKKYNDTFGHLAGNDALQRVARAIREAVRTVDFPARYGGEEFAVIVPEIDARALLVIGERIRAGVEAIPAPPEGAQVTVSIGAAMYPADGTTVDALFTVADERLYEAKKAGRNRVVGPRGTAAVVGGVVSG